MHKDAMRNKMDAQFYCSKHPDTELNFSSELTNVEFHSAYNVNIKIVIHPCERCQRESERISDAVNTLLSLSNGR